MDSRNSINVLKEIVIFFLVSSGIFLLFSIFFRWVDADYLQAARIVKIIATPGNFLFLSFSWLSFLIPLYLIGYAVILSSQRYDGKELIVLNVSLVPFLTMAVLLKMFTGNSVEESRVTEYLVVHLGRIPATIVVFLVFLIELVLLWKLGMELYERESSDEAEKLHVNEGVNVESGKKSGEKLNDLVNDLVRIEAPKERPKVSEKVDEVLLLEDKKYSSLSNVKPDFTVSQDEDTSPQDKNYLVPAGEVLKDYPDGKYWEIDSETQRAAEILMETLKEFKISAELTGIRKGPVITMFEILPAPGVKISKIVNLADNIALRLAALRVRIVAPIPGRHAVGIEIPNKKRNIVSFKEIITQDVFKESDFEIPVVLGKDITGEARIVDLVQTPHLLIAGATGSGKSVCVNAIVNSILFKKSPQQVRMILIDPKIVELKVYNDIPHLLTRVITDPKKAYQALQFCIDEMERRYALLDSMGVRDIHSYNKKIVEEKIAVTAIPYLVIVVDEFADLMATTGREMEATLARLAAMSRAVGIHLVLATQRPSIDVITGLIKANIPSRIAFMVASKFDSRIIIDTVGAEKLLGKGDMLFTAAWDPVPVRIQGAFLSESEVEAITDHLRSLGKPEYIDDEIFTEDENEELFGDDVEDPLLEKAMEIIFTAGKASASFLQRRLKIGYNRAARIIEELERRGIVGPQNGSKPREIIKAP